MNIRKVVMVVAIGFMAAAAGCSHGGSNGNPGGGSGPVGGAGGGSGGGTGGGTGAGGGSGSDTCSSATTCPLGSGSFQACTKISGTSCASSYYKTSSGKTFACKSCSDCTQAATDVSSWCTSKSDFGNESVSASESVSDSVNEEFVEMVRMVDEATANAE